MISNYYKMDMSKSPHCEECLLSKQDRSNYPISNGKRKAKSVLDRVSTDILEISTPSLEGHKYISGFIDEASKYIYIHPMKEKSETLSTFKRFIQEHDKPKTLRSDNGKEYTSVDFDNFCIEKEVKQELSCTYTSQQNGQIERSWRTLMNITRSNLIQSGLPIQLWNYAAIYSSRQMNHWVYKYKKKKKKKEVNFISTPWERMNKTPPDTNLLKPFGCDVYAHILKKHRHDKKLSPRSFKGVFLGIPDGTKGYLILDGPYKQ